jgi:predicted nucleotidyltransferase
MSFNGGAGVDTLLEQRRKETAGRIEELRQRLTIAEKLCGNRACVYATGSFSRGEANQYSDLDLFISGQGTAENRELSRLDEILIKADLIKATKDLNIPEFSGDGEYLRHYTVEELVQTLGTQQDDASNTFTARLLLLLESSPLLGKAAYDKVTDEVIKAYWRDYHDHKDTFMPAFLANDILRMWRTFCVNYEARTQDEPPQKKAKRRLTNFKLRHSRLLTCYSALLYLLAVFSKNETVRPQDATRMILLTPTQRLEWLKAQPELVGASQRIADRIPCYENFLTLTDAPAEELVKRVLDKQKWRTYSESANRFGDLMFEVLDAIGKGNPFYRLLVV